MGESDIKICYGLVDSTDYIENDGMRDLVRTLNFAFDSIMMPLVDKSPMDMLHGVADNTGYSHLAMFDSGTILTNGDKIRKALYHLCEDEWLVAGHIMQRQSDQYPYLHHQAYVVNIDVWKRLGRPDFGEGSRKTMTLPAAWKSSENIHDDYTPVWLKPHDGVTVNVSKVKFGWNMISTSLENGYTVPNLPRDARSSKIYIYPDDNPQRLLDKVATLQPGEDIDTAGMDNDSQKRFLRNQQWAMSNNSSEVYIFNTGDFQVNLPAPAPAGALWATASGFKQLAEWHYRGMPLDAEIHTYDYNPRSLAVWSTINEYWDGTDLYSFLRDRYDDCDDEDYYCWGNKLDYETPQQASDRQEAILQDACGGRDAFVEIWDSYRRLSHSYHEINLLENPGLLASRMAPGRHHYVWVNNIFYFNRTLRRYGVDSVQSRLLELATAIRDSGVDNHVIGQSAGLHFFDPAKTLVNRLLENPELKFQCQMEFENGARRWAGHPLPY